MGCTILPPQLTEADIPGLPYIEYAPAPNLGDVSFPDGDLVQLGASGVSKNFSQLATVLDKAFDGQSFGENTVTVGVIIIKNGKLIAERYRRGFGVHSGYRTWSTAKSLSAALLGIAARKGIVDFDGPAQVPEWQYDGDPRREITYKHLLWMSSGLYGGGNNTNAIYFGGQDVISAATTTRLEVEPGTRWKYSNNDTLLYLRALRSQLDDDLAYLRFPYDELFHRIGMYHTRMETDHLGNFIGSSQVYTTARDLARFGVLLANDGVWNDERILPEGWVDFSRSPAPTRSVQKGMRGYGAQFWLLDQMPGVPAGTFTSAGNKGQFVTVLPDHDIVIVRTGVDPIPARFQQDQLVAAVIGLL
jgi:CubicO group peptidase (beta-lactamase class C family)